MGIFGGGNSIFNNPLGNTDVSWAGSAAKNITALAPIVSPITGVWNYLSSQLNQSGPALQAPPMPPNPSAVAGASLQTDVQQEAQQYSASTLLNGGQGVPFGNSGLMASNILRAGVRG